MQIELSELAEILRGSKPGEARLIPGANDLPQMPNRHGVSIVIADRGHVWVGDVVTQGEWCVISKASAVRLWGTTKGLGEIAQGGPTSKTVLDPVGEVRVSMRALIAVIPCEASKWKL